MGDNGVLSFHSIPQDNSVGDSGAAAVASKKKKKKIKHARGGSPIKPLNEVKSQINNSIHRFGSITNQTMNLSSKLLNITSVAAQEKEIDQKSK